MLIGRRAHPAGDNLFPLILASIEQLMAFMLQGIQSPEPWRGSRGEDLNPAGASRGL